MRMGWVKRKLRDVCTLQRGFDLPSSERRSGVYPLISSSGFIDSHTEAKVAGPGVVTGRSGSIGAVHFVEDDFWPLNTTLYVKDFHGNNRRFIYHLLTAFDLGRFTSGAGVPTLNRNHVHEEPVWIPVSVDDQERIVAILDDVFGRIDAAVANAEKNLANVRKLFESYLNRVFMEKGDGWVERTLETLGRIVTGSTPKTSQPANFGSFIPFIKPGDFRSDGSLEFENEGLSEIGLQKSRQFPSGSILMVCIGATIGKTGLTTKDIAANQQINGLIPREGLDPEFIYFQMLSDRFQRYVREGSGQATLPIINKTKWSNLRLNLPPTLEEQRRISQKLSSLGFAEQRLKSVYQRKLTTLAELKQSVLQKAFSGKLPAEAMDLTEATAA